MAKRLTTWQIWNDLRLEASNPYQERVPRATKALSEQVVDNLLNNRPDRNEFLSGLWNKFGLSYVRSQTFENPMRAFKKGDLPFGAAVEELQLGLARAYTYSTDRADLEQMIFGREYLENQSSVHKITRQEFYKISTNDVELRRALLNGSYGLDDYMKRILDVPKTSDEWDEFIQMTNLFSLYDEREGFFIQNVPALSLDSTEADAKYFLKVARQYAETLPFPSRHYNASGMPVWASADKLHLFLTPVAAAAIDVDALAALFNIERGEVPFRRHIVPPENFGAADVQAILTTEDFFQVWDTFYGVREQENPVTLDRNQFLHHHSIISFSRFVPAILFSSTRPTTVINDDPTPVESVDALVVRDVNGIQVTELERGSQYRVYGSAVTNPEGGWNDAVETVLTGAGEDFVNLSTYTFLRQNGSMFISIDEAADNLTITATALDDKTKTATLTLPVVGDRVIVWPNPEVIPGTEDVEP